MSDDVKSIKLEYNGQTSFCHYAAKDAIICGTQTEAWVSSEINTLKTNTSQIIHFKSDGQRDMFRLPDNTMNPFVNDDEVRILYLLVSPKPSASAQEVFTLGEIAGVRHIKDKFFYQADTRRITQTLGVPSANSLFKTGANKTMAKAWAGVIAILFLLFLFNDNDVDEAFKSALLFFGMFFIWVPASFIGGFWHDSKENKITDTYRQKCKSAIDSVMF